MHRKMADYIAVRHFSVNSCLRKKVSPSSRGRGRGNKMKSALSGDMRLGKGSSQPTSVRPGCPWHPGRARSRALVLSCSVVLFLHGLRLFNRLLLSGGRRVRPGGTRPAGSPKGGFHLPGASELPPASKFWTQGPKLCTAHGAAPSQMGPPRTRPPPPGKNGPGCIAARPLCKLV